MAFTLVAYSESQDSATLVNVAALVDPHVRVVGDDIVVPTALNYVGGVYGIGTAITRAQLVSPSIRRRYPFEVTPVEISTEPSDPVKMLGFFSSPIGLDPDEGLNFQADQRGPYVQRHPPGWGVCRRWYAGIFRRAHCRPFGLLAVPVAARVHRFRYVG